MMDLRKRKDNTNFNIVNLILLVKRLALITNMSAKSKKITLKEAKNVLRIKKS